MRRNKRETRSGGVCTISLSRNSLTPRLSYTACYTVLLKVISVGRNFCVHTPVCHASWVLNGVCKRFLAFFLSASSCIPRTAKFAYLRLHTPQALASSIRSGALYISLPPPIEASSAFTLFLLPFNLNRRSQPPPPRSPSPPPPPHAVPRRGRRRRRQRCDRLFYVTTMGAAGHGLYQRL